MWSTLFFTTPLLLSPLIITPTTAQVNANFPGLPVPWGIGLDDWSHPYTLARAFVSSLTLPEKVNLTTGTGRESDLCVGQTGSIPRLSFAPLCLQDGPLGVRYTDLSTAFPAGMNVASTWSRRLMRTRGEALGEEFGGKGVDVMLGPVAGPLGRSPEGGRGWEGFSPDPYLTGVGMGETVRGIQSRGVVAVAKHYIGNEQEHFRGGMDVRVDDRTMHEVYLWPFADAVRAGVGGVMCAYNKVNGSWGCENDWTVGRLLKGELGFQGFVVSDWGAQHDGVNSALMGLDMSMPGDGGPKPYGSLWGGALGEMVLNGSVPVWRLDDMVVRIMAAFFKVHVGNYTARPEVNFSSWTKNDTGPLHPSSNSSWTTVNRHVNVQSDHALLAREIAAKSIVLLKNEGNILPLKDPGSIAIIGTDALDDPAGPNACPDRGCNTGTLAMGYGSGTAEFPYLISPATAILNRTSHDNSTTPVILDPSTVPLSALKLAASQVSIPLVFANADAGEGYITLDNNQGDRNNLSLWSNMQAVTETIASANPNTILILHTPGPVILEWARTNPNISAILWAGLPGQESGNALVDVLWGDINPQGRSPFTWGKKEGDWGPMQVTYTVPNPKSPVQTFEEGVWVDYRYFDAHGMEPSWEFGFGMGYTSFLYNNLSVEAYNTTYLPASGMTPPAPTYGTVDGRAEANTVPDGFEKIPKYIYPWIDPASFAAHNGSGIVGPKEAYDGSPQRIVPAGGASGGNKGLYEVVYTISCTVRNTGKVFGTEIPQLYLQLGGGLNPPTVLRGFDEVPLAPGESKTVVFNVTRRDISNWDTRAQDWVVNDYDKIAFVGSSSRSFHLNVTLPRVW